MMKFKVVAGFHKTADGQKLGKGDVFESASPLDQVFKGKFVRVEDVAPLQPVKAAAPVVTQPDPVVEQEQEQSEQQAPEQDQTPAAEEPAVVEEESAPKTKRRRRPSAKV